MGIIAILAAVITVGIFSALGNTGDRATQLRLDTLQQMYKTWEQDSTAAAGSGAQGGKRSLSTAVRSNAAQQPPSAVNAEDPFADPVAKDWSVRTQQMIRRLLSTGSNRETWDGVDNRGKTGQVTFATFTYDNGGLLATAIDQTEVFADYSGTPEKAPLDPALLKDAGDSIILWVPPAGLTGMTNEGDPSWMATDILVAIDGDGFFMAPGDDNDYRTHDDNLYSTELRKQP